MTLNDPWKKRGTEVMKANLKMTRRRLLATTVMPLAVAAMVGVSQPVSADSHGCNPCAASACSACNPCNPCAAKSGACNPCNPCAANN